MALDAHTVRAMPPPGLLEHLDDEQRAAAMHTGPPLLLVAGAGSGKTTTLAARLAWLVHGGADPRRLLLISFSRRAAGELAARAGQSLHAALGLPARVRPPALPWCGTFHAVAARLLREEAPSLGLASGFTVLDRADAEELMAQQRLALGLAQGLARSERRLPLAATALAIHSRCVNTGAPLAEVLALHFPWCRVGEAGNAATQDAPADGSAPLRQLFEAYTQAKLDQQALDLDDLLAAWSLALDDAVVGPRLRARFDAVLVDEVQDLNPLQWRLLEQLCPGGQGLTLVGDDAQAIYGFRGASVAQMLTFPARCTPPAVVRLLQANRRSTAPILAAADALIAQASERFAKTLKPTRQGGQRPTLHVVADEAAEARGVADAVLLARESGIVLRRQAVLYRTGTHAQALELELARRGIPFVKYGGLRFLESAHLKDVLALLRWADNPHAALAATRAARLVPGIGAAALARLLAVQADLARFEPPRAARADWAGLVALLQRLREAPQWPADLQAVLAWYRPHLERLHADARERWADLEQLAAAATRHGSRAAFVTELTIEPPAAHGAESGEPHRDEDWLVLSTLHSAKGQEWSAVHILRVVDGAIPADLATGRAEEIAEERRLLYVGMTRARDTLALWAPQSFHVTQQRAWGGRHVGALRSRFIDDAVMATLELVTPEPPETAREAEALPHPAAALPGTGPDAPAQGPGTAEAAEARETSPAAESLLARLARSRQQGWRSS